VEFVSRQLSLNRTAIRFASLLEIPRLGNGKVDFNALKKGADHWKLNN